VLSALPRSKRFNPEDGHLKRASIWAVLFSIALLAGCSKKPGGPPARESKSGAPQVAEANCPATFAFPTRLAGAPVDDILDMRQGATLSDAMLFLRCRSGAHFVFTEENRGIIQDPHGQKFRQVVTATDGVARARPYDYAKAMMTGEKGTPQFDFVTEKVMFWSLGLQDKEIVWGIWRSQFFKPGEQPAAGQLAEQLSAKYGQPNFMQQESRFARFAWVYDRSGVKLPQSINALGRCDINAQTDGEHVVRGDCGLTVEAYVAKANNPLLADSVSVAVIDQNIYLDATKDFEQVLATAQAQQQSSEASKAKPATKF
jgi:hypothetical protein